MSEKDESSTSLVKPRFEIVKWNAVFLWKYKDVLDDCAICRNSLNDVCNYCQQAFIEEDDHANNIPEGKKFKEWLKCDLTWGKCSHAFHTHCINKWIQQRNICPLDNKNWEVEK